MTPLQLLEQRIFYSELKQIFLLARIQFYLQSSYEDKNKLTRSKEQ